MELVTDGRLRRLDRGGRRSSRRRRRTVVEAAALMAAALQVMWAAGVALFVAFSLLCIALAL